MYDPPMKQGNHIHFHQWSAPRSKNAKSKGRVPTDREKLRLLSPGPPCKRLPDFTEAEIVDMEHEYGAPIIRP